MKRKIETEYNQIPDEFHSFDHKNSNLKNEFSNENEYEVTPEKSKQASEEKAKKIKNVSTLIALVTGGTTIIVGEVISLTPTQNNSLININEITENSVNFSFSVIEEDPDINYFGYVYIDNDPSNYIYARLEYYIDNVNPNLRNYEGNIYSLEASTKYVLTVGKIVINEQVILETTSFTTLSHVDNQSFFITINEITANSLSFSFTNYDETGNDNYVAYVLSNSYSQVAMPNKIYSRITKDNASSEKVHIYNGLIENLISNNEYTLSVAQIDPASGEEILLGEENFTTLEY